MPPADDGPFLKHEKRLLKTIADRIGNFILHQQLREAAEERREEQPRESTGEWRVILNLLHHTDRTLFENVSEKMLNHPLLERRRGSRTAARARSCPSISISRPG